jgi:hypothetical protein
VRPRKVLGDVAAWVLGLGVWAAFWYLICVSGCAP